MSFMVCPDCSGAGAVDVSAAFVRTTNTCRTCDGDGEIADRALDAAFAVFTQLCEAGTSLRVAFDTAALSYGETS